MLEVYLGPQGRVFNSVLLTFNSLQRSPDKPFPIIPMVHWALKEAENPYTPSPVPILHFYDPFHPCSFLSCFALLIHKTRGCRIALPSKVIHRNGFRRAWCHCFFLMPCPTFSWCLDAMESKIRCQLSRSTYARDGMMGFMSCLHSSARIQMSLYQCEMPGLAQC